MHTLLTPLLLVRYAPSSPPTAKIYPQPIELLYEMTLVRAPVAGLVVFSLYCTSGLS